MDYGNNHVVTLSKVKEIPVKVVSGYKTFAIPCGLDKQQQLNSQVRTNFFFLYPVFEI